MQRVQERAQNETYPEKLAAFGRWEVAERKQPSGLLKPKNLSAEVSQDLIVFLADGAADGSIAARALVLINSLCPDMVDWDLVLDRCRIRPGQWDSATVALDRALPSVRLKFSGERRRWARYEIRRVREKALKVRADNALQKAVERELRQVAEVRRLSRWRGFVQRRNGECLRAAAEMEEMDRQLGLRRAI